jgi:hypothetical protein
MCLDGRQTEGGVFAASISMIEVWEAALPKRIFSRHVEKAKNREKQDIYGLDQNCFAG